MEAVAEQWKEQAKAANDHDHLGQTWVGEGSPLKLHGSFSEPYVFPSSDLSPGVVTKLPRRPSAPLFLDNTNRSGLGLKVLSDGSGITVLSEGPDLILRGDSAIISATDDAYQNLSIRLNNNVYLYLDYNRDDPHTSGLYIFGRDGYSILELNEDGDMWLRGSLTEAGPKTRNNRPQNPANEDFVNASVDTMETRNSYDGVALLDARGEAWVEAPESFAAPGPDCRYQLTPIGAPAPNLYVAEEIENHRFKIAGGSPGQKVSWQVSWAR